MARLSDTGSKILSLLSDCKHGAFNGIVKETGLDEKAVEGVLYRLWKDFTLILTKKNLRISKSVKLKDLVKKLVSSSTILFS